MEDLDNQVGATLKPALREMLRLRVSHINGCGVCVRLYSESLAALGARPDVIAAMARPARHMRPELVSEGDVAALRLAEVLTDAPRGLEPEAREQAGLYFNRTQLGAIVETIAVVNAWNRITRGTE